MKKINKSKLNLKSIKEWRTRTAKNEPDKPANYSEAAEENRAVNSDGENINRRLLDTVSSKNPKRKLNLDRRTVNSERRANTYSNYTGTARRYTIDRRLNQNDRRDKG